MCARFLFNFIFCGVNSEIGTGYPGKRNLTRSFNRLLWTGLRFRASSLTFHFRVPVKHANRQPVHDILPLFRLSLGRNRPHTVKSSPISIDSGESRTAAVSMTTASTLNLEYRPTRVCSTCLTQLGERHCLLIYSRARETMFPKIRRSKIAILLLLSHDARIR